MSNNASSPVFFDEIDFRRLTNGLAAVYSQNCRDLFSPNVDRNEWLRDFEATKRVLSVSMCDLNDSDPARVNNCRFTLPPLATYHEIITRMCRELEDYVHGGGERVAAEKTEANVEEFKEARRAVAEAWRRDVRAGALAGLRRSRKAVGGA